MIRTVHASLLLALAAGCAPQSAQITAGDYRAFFAATNSLTVVKGDVPLGADVEDDTWESYYTVDCREFETASTPEQTEALRLPDRLRICDGDPNESPTWPPDHETWLETNGFYVAGEQLDPWRGEGIITSEGDIQIGFHHRLPGGEDFRFMFVVNPNFQPRECVQNADGTGVELVDVDGDWVENWSTGAGGRTRFFLNGGSFMWDADTAENNTSGQDPPQWLLPNWWQAGFGGGRIGDDDLRIRTTRFANPEIYLAVEAAELAGGTVVTYQSLFFCRNESQCEQEATFANNIADNVAAEFAMVGLEDVEGLPSSRPVVHGNRWRPFQPNDAAHLSHWTEMHYNWVEFDEDPAGAEPGDPVSGRFHLLLDGLDSSTRVVVRGTFDVPKLKRDRWTTDYIPPELIERNETELCGGQGNDDPSYIY